MTTENPTITQPTTATPDTSGTTAAKTTTPALPKQPPAVRSIVTGKVFRSASQDKPYVLVQLADGFMGLLHESQLSGSDRGARNGRLRSLGAKQQLELLVTSVDVKEGKTRISLSERALDTQKALDAIPVGTDIVGTVQNTEAYGAFIDLGNGISGLLHVKELPGNSPREQDGHLAELKKGDPVGVRVIDVDTKGPKLRIALSMRAAEQEAQIEHLKSGVVIKGTVIGQRDGNFSISLGHGVTGLLSMDEVRKLGKGDHVRVKLASADGGVITLTRKGIA